MRVLPATDELRYRKMNNFCLRTAAKKDYQKTEKLEFVAVHRVIKIWVQYDHAEDSVHNCGLD